MWNRPVDSANASSAGLFHIFSRPIFYHSELVSAAGDQLELEMERFRDFI